MADILDALIAEGFRELPVRAVPGQSPARPARSPIEQESRFVRYACWFDVVRCACGAERRSFDGLFEEREFIQGGGRHWLRLAATRPGASGVIYLRKHTVAYCEQCARIESWPLAAEYDGPGTNPALVRMETPA
jgi:hypothetical protein